MRLFVVQGRAAREILTFKEFEGGAAASGDVGHLAGEAALVDGADGVATTDDANRVGIGNRLADAHGASSELVHLEAAHRAVPDDGLGVLDDGGVELDGLGTDVEGHPVCGDVVTDNLRGSFGVELVCGDVVDGEQELDASGLGGLEGGLGGVKKFVFAEGLADVVSLAFKKV